MVAKLGDVQRGNFAATLASEPELQRTEGLHRPGSFGARSGADIERAKDALDLGGGFAVW
jgi:hypothetical protein